MSIIAEMNEEMSVRIEREKVISSEALYLLHNDIWLPCSENYKLVMRTRENFSHSHFERH